MKIIVVFLVVLFAFGCASEPSAVSDRLDSPAGRVNVLDFGCAGDGVTDDTACIQSAVDSISSGRPGGTIFFPCGPGVGTYKITDEITSGHGGLRFLGCGPTRQNDGPVSNLYYGSTILASGVSKKFFNIDGGASVGFSGPIFEYLNFLGDDITAVSTTNNIDFIDGGGSNDKIKLTGQNATSLGFTVGMEIAVQYTNTIAHFTGSGVDDLDFSTGPNEITRTAGSFITDGFKVGFPVSVSNTASNNGTKTVTAVAALILTVSDTLTLENNVDAKLVMRSSTDGIYTVSAISTTSTTDDTLEVPTGSFTAGLTGTNARVSNRSMFISIRAKNNGAVRYCSFNGLHIAINLDSGQPDLSGGDASWIDLIHNKFRQVDRAISQPDLPSGVQSSFLVQGGNFLIRDGGYGIYMPAANPQSRVIGTKMDGPDNSIGILLRGYGAMIIGNTFEDPGIAIAVEAPGPHWLSGRRNTLIGNFFTVNPTAGIYFGPDTNENNAHANLYNGTSVGIDDHGIGNCVHDYRHEGCNFKQTELAGPQTIPVNQSHVHLKTFDPGDDFDLPDGRDGQIMQITYTRDNGNQWCKVTPDNFLHGSHIEFRAEGETVKLKYIKTNEKLAGRWHMVSGTAHLIGAVEGMLFQETTAVGTDSGTSEKTLLSYSLPAHTLVRDKTGIRIRAWGQTGGSATEKQIRLKFGATTLYDSGLSEVAPNDEDWYIEATVYRTGASTQDAIVQLGFYDGAVIAPVFSNPSDSLASATTVSITGQNGSGGVANDIIAEGFSVEYLP
jgi:Pectate lyase superfamily protein